MKISSSIVAMSSQQHKTEITAQTEQLQVWFNSQAPVISPQASPDIVDLSEQAKSMYAQMLETSETACACKNPDTELSDKDKLKIQLIEDFITAWTGKKFKFAPVAKIPPQKDSLDINTIPGNKPNVPAPSRNIPDWGLRYERHEYHAESEKLSFASTAYIKTADGREINIALQFNLQRSSISESHTQILAGNAKIDPLIINFAGTSAELTERKFEFDLDFDGSNEQISFVQPGSGFLALDKNNDGIINDGQELFGPQNGDGFAELAKYDQNSDGWIDESDPIFDNLRIWAKDESGRDVLFALGQKGVGAIYLGAISTEFSLKNPAGALQGQLRSTSIFVNENGSSGTIQHIDLAV